MSAARGMRAPLRHNGPPRHAPFVSRIAPILASLLFAFLVYTSSFPPSSSLSSSDSAPNDTNSRHLPSVNGCRPLAVTTLEPRENAAIVVLLRASDLSELLPTLANFEDKFNAAFRYPYVFLSDPGEGPLPPAFRRAVQGALPGGAVVEYGVVPEAHWRIPGWMDEDAMRRGFKEQEARGVQYAGREGYHHMCRWYSGLWVQHPLLAKYEWFWRLEPGVRFFCSLTYDPIRFLSVNRRVYGFSITVVENDNTIPTLFSTVQRYMAKRGIRSEDLDPALWGFLTRKENGKEFFSGCHSWTNLEIGDLRFFRSPQYQDFFRFLDQDGGFYRERWGDAPVRALGLGLFANLSQIHQFDDIGYQHDFFFRCPRKSTSRVPSSAWDPLVQYSLDGPTTGCKCECPREGDLQGRKKGEEAVDMDKDWRWSCQEHWRTAGKKSLEK